MTTSTPSAPPRRSSGARLVAALTCLAGVGASVAVVALQVPASATSAVPTAADGALVKVHYRAAVSSLKVTREVGTGYQRSAFRLWDDADHDCRDTRAEVLVGESTTRTTGSCTVKTGRWVSAYDGVVVTTASQLDIDHVVPLAEAWASGARSWSSGKREAYANDLAEGKALVAVTAHANRSKGDRDPAEWQPLKSRCTYLSNWVAVKLRWGLSVDSSEKHALLLAIGGCGDPTVTTHRAVVRNAGAGHSTTTTSGSAGGTSSGGGSGLDPRFRTCTAAIAAGYGPYVSGKDPEYAWYVDRDHDGVVCE